MDVSHQIVYEKLMAGNMKISLSLKEQAMTKLAIHLCHFQLKKTLIQSSEFCSSFIEWRKCITKHSLDACERLPPKLKDLLIHRIWLTAFRFSGWNAEHRLKIHTLPHVADEFLMPSDWTVEGRINERKVAERLVQDERISVSNRYELACLNFLEPYTHLLWNQNPPEHQEVLMENNSMLVKLWSYYLIGTLDKDYLWQHGFLNAVKEGQRTAVVYCWDMVSERAKQNIITEVAMIALKSYDRAKTLFWDDMSAHYTADMHTHSDILHFIFSKMSDTQRFTFFQYVFSISSVSYMFDCFLEYPYHIYFISIIKKLWDILPENKYLELLRVLVILHKNNEIEYYDYGQILVELLESSPENFNRFAFANFSFTGDLLSLLSQNKPIRLRSIKVIQAILQHARMEERGSFIYSTSGEELCKSLLKNGHLEVLKLVILADCLPEMDLRKKFLLSARGREACFWILACENGESVNALLNWGSFSENEISDFKSSLIWDVSLSNGTLVNSLVKKRHSSEQMDAWDPIKSFTDLLHNFDTDSMDRVLQWCLPSENTQKQYKEQLLSIIKICDCVINIFILHADSCDLKTFISKLSQFLDWIFSSKADRKLFKQELFTKGFPGMVLDKYILHEQWWDVDFFVAWFELNSKEIQQLKIDVLCEYKTRQTLFDLLKKSDIKTILFYLEWGLPDAKTVRAYQKAIKDTQFHSHNRGYMKDAEQLHQKWDQLIEDRLSNLTRKRHNVKSDVENQGLDKENNPCKKFKKQ